ncbi:MAG: hypothetical protein ACRD8O_09015 [Bryobacteraceae bacterium]
MELSLEEACRLVVRHPGFLALWARTLIHAGEIGQARALHQEMIFRAQNGGAVLLGLGRMEAATPQSG